MKTIAIVINTSWNIYNFRLSLMQALQHEGYRVIAIAPADSYSDKLVSLGFEFHHIAFNNKGTNPLEELKLIWTFYKLYKSLKPDLLLHFTIKPNIYGSLAAGMLKIPVISNISGLGTVFLNNKLTSRIARLLYKIALYMPKKVFFQNADDRALFVDLKLVQRDKTRLLPGSGINPDVFKPLVRTESAGRALQFLFIARLVRDKGLIEFVDAARMLKVSFPDIEFAILGAFYPGNPTAITEFELKQWQVDGIVKYLGTSDDVKSLIATADCIVLPSYREGLSRVLLEAASMAKPIITTNVPGCRDVVDDGVNGFLCKVRDAEVLARQMEKMIQLKQSQRAQMGKKGREKVIQQFDERIVIAHYIKAINDIFS